jgi:hypothetical protein
MEWEKKMSWDIEWEETKPQRIHNTDAESDAVMLEHERERKHFMENDSDE